MIKVLIVEDDPMVAEMNKFYLSQTEGFIAAGSARSAEEALGLLLKHSYDLILLDIYMKSGNGLELLSEIRRRGIKVDVIIISAASDKGNIQEALQNGVVDYLIKPFEFSRFRTALDGYREQNKLFRNRQSLSQSELDKFARFKQDRAGSMELGKGFTRQTLQTIWTALECGDSDSFSADEISARSGISRVSVNKYLVGLAELGILDMELSYGHIGRPVQKYRISQNGRTLIMQYIR
ncbi:response regulator [Paenibacillus sp. NFR01]|uniref:response regulator n=1 Tax=Paenibacillus sp. NFR01 TaxID=1566279 RepID=UPI0008C6E438|nr:response regulator [Paenibacillus sp. NFR01]SET88795.1 two-component system, CitB family, response regulator MalR [Paenibacillus sp. NFR01]